MELFLSSVREDLGCSLQWTELHDLMVFAVKEKSVRHSQDGVSIWPEPFEDLTTLDW